MLLFSPGLGAGTPQLSLASAKAWGGGGGTGLVPINLCGITSRHWVYFTLFEFRS